MPPIFVGFMQFDAGHGLKPEVAIWTDDAMVAHPEVIDDLTRWKALELGELARFMSSGQNDNSYAAAKAAYQSRFDQLARITNKLPIRDHTGSAGTVVTLGITRR